MSSKTRKTPAIMPCRTMRGHTDWVNSVITVVHLPGGRRIITCSTDGSFRLWDLESGTQIEEEWRDEDYAGVRTMVLSPNGKTVASGCDDGKVRLWDIETRKVIAKWTGHTDVVDALRWSKDERQNCPDNRNRATWVKAVIYSPDATKIATGGWDDDAVKIWNAKTGELLKTLEHNAVWSLAWTSDGKKLISGSYGPIRIFDTATWEEIAVLEGHTKWINAIALSRNGRLLASASDDKTARLWNLDTNLPVRPPLQHESFSLVAKTITRIHGTFTPPSKKLALKTSSNLYLMYIPWFFGKDYASLPLAGSSAKVVDKQQRRTTSAYPGSSNTGVSLFDGVQNGAQSSAARGAHHCSPAHNPRSTRPPLLERFSYLFHHSHRDTDDGTELQRRPRRSFSRGPPIIEVAAVKDREVIFTAPPPPQKTQQQSQSHSQGSSTTQPASGSNPTTPRPRHPHSLPVRLLADLVLLLCCASPRPANGNAHPTQQQQQGQSEGQAQGQALSSQTQPAALLTSTMLPAPAPSTAASGGATVQSRPLLLRARSVLSLCCASPPHADSHSYRYTIISHLLLVLLYSYIFFISFRNYARQSCFLVMRLVQCIELNNDNHCKRNILESIKRMKVRDLRG
ncbi:WD40-repeat-containing domain protein [Suillus subalutaceus]|uniref:WD40-repeat-containing domain protein n=1 Tax=Suillus subalutaceus TaxID=48586 RepID=UPI001B8672D1|nr:WD40-repeat-containing domain protein [Suillus subalutaceus]KAG1840602.1 WD40-repeat-containing domain protein [Suillus subalutaceus]